MEGARHRDDPSVATRAARSSTIFNSHEGPVQIIEHLQFHTDADGNVRVDHTFELRRLLKRGLLGPKADRKQRSAALDEKQ
jgi:hypothetical protein